eukprot:TRINITY_DN654_c0_g1_i4.p2 TRINITY_DN654_c0_g1~~TRINITY_DN654_c0_g1_i4.p2  ORF type:complete len:270 (-),score=125.78 TRINITY_DN654_c0_g1_i4:1008-1817(-)
MENAPKVPTKYIRPIRAVQFVFALLVLALEGRAIDTLPSSYNRSPFNFLLVTAIIAMIRVVIAFLRKPMYNNRVRNVVYMAGEAIVALFFFCGFIAAADGGPTNCEHLDFYNPDTAYGGACRSNKAAAAFGAFSWILWTITAYHVITTTDTSNHPYAPQNPYGDNNRPSMAPDTNAYSPSYQQNTPYQQQPADGNPFITQPPPTTFQPYQQQPSYQQQDQQQQQQQQLGGGGAGYDRISGDRSYQQEQLGGGGGDYNASQHQHQEYQNI